MPVRWLKVQPLTQGPGMTVAWLGAQERRIRMAGNSTEIRFAELMDCAARLGELISGRNRVPQAQLVLCIDDLMNRLANAIAPDPDDIHLFQAAQAFVAIGQPTAALSRLQQVVVRAYQKRV